MSAAATLLSMTEKAWQAQVVELARTLGWAVYHPFLSIHSERGFPDLTLCRERIVFVELKAEKGKVSEAQEKWLARLREAGAEAYVWRPSQFDEAVATLSRNMADEMPERLIARMRAAGWTVAKYTGSAAHPLPVGAQEQEMHITWRREVKP